MKYLYAKGDRVISRNPKLKDMHGKVTVVVDRSYSGEGYHVYLDTTPDAPGKIVFSLEDDLYPESPTYEQAKRELGRTMQAMVTHQKAYLVLLEESIKWAKKTKELMPPPVLEQIVPPEGVKILDELARPDEPSER